MNEKSNIAAFTVFFIFNLQNMICDDIVLLGITLNHLFCIQAILHLNIYDGGFCKKT